MKRMTDIDPINSWRTPYLQLCVDVCLFKLEYTATATLSKHNHHCTAVMRMMMMSGILRAFAYAIGVQIVCGGESLMAKPRNMYLLGIILFEEEQLPQEEDFIKA